MGTRPGYGWSGPGYIHETREQENERIALLVQERKRQDDAKKNEAVQRSNLFKNDKIIQTVGGGVRRKSRRRKTNYRRHRKSTCRRYRKH
jgi:hypothetical protein